MLLRRMKGYKDSGEVLNASCMFAALTNGESKEHSLDPFGANR